MLSLSRPWLLCLGLLAPVPAVAADCVILLHGLARSDRTMTKLAESLSDNGFWTVNVDYPSLSQDVSELADRALPAAIEDCGRVTEPPYHVVTHSLGGIMVREYRAREGFPDLGRVVMLAPPNRGSEVVDRMEGFPGFEWILGPAVIQLSTDDEDLPARLGPVDFELGVIAGTRSIDPVSSLMLPNPDDGKVSVESTRVEGMCSMLVLPVTHALMMRNDTVIGEVIHFLENGRFASPEAENDLCL